MFTTFANLGMLVLLLCLGAVISLGAALIYALWCTDKKARQASAFRPVKDSATA